jgi:superfamily II DNA helicase RecQ
MPEYSGIIFEGILMINADGKVDFNFVTLESTKGKFYLEHPRKKNIVYEVSHDQFRILFVKMAQDNAKGIVFENRSNSFEYLMSQLEMNEDLFQAMLYPNSDWTI